MLGVLRPQRTVSESTSDGVQVGESRKIDPAELESKLATLFIHEGMPFGLAHYLFEAEDAHARNTLKYKGFLVHADAAKCFFLETVGTLNRNERRVPPSQDYVVFLPRIVQCFQSLYASERTALRGYPFHSYTLLRNTLDNVLLLAAVLQGITDFDSIEGIEHEKAFDPRTARELRKRTERSVREVMTGEKSGLTLKTVQELSRWDAMFDYEVHGARLSLSHTKDWLAGSAPLPVLPVFNEKAFAMFMNRYYEVGWMIHRVIPAMQPPGVALSDDWCEKWRALDESFFLFVDSLTSECGLRIGAAVCELVSKKFPFSDKSTFPT